MAPTPPNLPLQNKTYKQEICRLNARTLQLSSQLSDLSLQSETSHSTIQLLNQRLAQTVSQKDEEAAVAKQLQATSSKLELEYGQHQSAWQRERELLQQQLRESREKVRSQQGVKSTAWASVVLGGVELLLSRGVRGAAWQWGKGKRSNPY